MNKKKTNMRQVIRTIVREEKLYISHTQKINSI